MRDTNLMPENDMQELWELNGRVKAVIAYLKTDAYVKNEEILVMLGDVSETPDQTISELEKEYFYFDRHGEPIGCDDCIRREAAYE